MPEMGLGEKIRDAYNKKPQEIKEVIQEVFNDIENALNLLSDELRDDIDNIKNFFDSLTGKQKMSQKRKR